MHGWLSVESLGAINSKLQYDPMICNGRISWTKKKDMFRRRPYIHSGVLYGKSVTIRGMPGNATDSYMLKPDPIRKGWVTWHPPVCQKYRIITAMPCQSDLTPRGDQSSHRRRTIMGRKSEVLPVCIRMIVSYRFSWSGAWGRVNGMLHGGCSVVLLRFVVCSA